MTTTEQTNMTQLTEQPPQPVTCYLRKVRINQGGYDDAGRYWGQGEPLYQYEFEQPPTWDVHHQWTCSGPQAVMMRHPYGSEASTVMRCPECYRVATQRDNDVSEHVRAYDREDAKRQILMKYPNVALKFAR